jgi:hypothetical protein
MRNHEWTRMNTNKHTNRVIPAKGNFQKFRVVLFDAKFGHQKPRPNRRSWIVGHSRRPNFSTRIRNHGVPNFWKVPFAGMTMWAGMAPAAISAIEMTPSIGMPGSAMAERIRMNAQTIKPRRPIHLRRAPHELLRKNTRTWRIVVRSARSGFAFHFPAPWFQS